jgi:hypothetical protein
VHPGSQILITKYSCHTRERPHGLKLHGRDAGMGMRATHQRRVQETRQLNIVHETPAATQQARIFDACHGSAKIPCAHMVSFARSVTPMAHAVGPITYCVLFPVLTGNYYAIDSPIQYKD